MRKSDSAVGALFVALALTMTWPLAWNIRRAVADTADPYINTWILDWDWYATFHRPLSLFDANMFYPARLSLAFSENLYGIAVLLFPLRAIGVGPLTAHNLAVLFGYAFSGFGAYLLARYVTGSALAGVVSGIFYAFVPFRFTHAPHVQHVWGGWLPLLLLALLHYAARPTWKNAGLFAAAFLANGLSSIHAFLFGAVAIAISAAILRPPWKRLTVSSGIALLLLAPFLYPYYEASKMYGMKRSWTETTSYSARPSDWLVSSVHNRTYGGLIDRSVDPERWLFPGALSMVMATAGLFGRNRKAVLIALAWLLLGFVGSLGLHAFFHRFLFSYVPGFQAIRVPARWAMIAYVGLAMLVALGTAVVARRWRWIAVVLAAAFLVELRAAPLCWFMSIPDVPPVDRWIAATKPRAIAEIPIDLGGDLSDLLYATAHHRPMVNGASGFEPPEFTKIVTLARQEPIPDALLDELQRIGCEFMVVHADWIPESTRAWLRREVERGRLAFVRRFDGGISGDWVFAVGRPGPTPPALNAFLRGEPTFNETTFGTLDQPNPNETLRSAWFSGYALSPYGIREVNLLFNNGLIRETTILRAEPSLSRHFPWYDATPRPRFVRAFPSRPRGVWRSTDVQVEIVDGRGGRTLLGDRFIEWP